MNNSFFSITKSGYSRLFSGLFLGALLTTAISGCSDSVATEENTSAAQTYYHQAQSDVLQQQNSYSVVRKFVGKVQAKQNANIGFEQAGKVAILYVDEGDVVKKGAILAQQDVELLTIERDEMQARMTQTRADLILVKANLKRIRALKKRSFSSQQNLEELEARQQGLLSTKQRIDAGLHSLTVKIEKSTLLAPFDAVVSKRFISSGEVIAAGTSALNILQIGQDEVKVGVPTALLSQLQLDQTLAVTIGEQTHQVKLLTKGLDVDQVTRTVQLRFKLIGDEHQVINGQLAYLHLPQQYQAAGYWVPMTALTDGIRGLWNVYTLKADGQNDIFTLQSRNVQILYATKDAAYISGAMNDGERYLTAGLHRLVPGQQVKTALDSTTAISEINLDATQGDFAAESE